MSIAPRPGPRPLDFIAFACASAMIVASGVLNAQPLAAQLIAFDTDGSDSVGFVAPAGPIHAPVTALRLRFDLPVLPELGDFRVIHAGADGVLGTAACGSLPAGDDVDIDLVSAVAIDPRNVLIALDSPTGLRSGEYGILVCDSLLGVGGLPLDGDEDGLPGGIALREFSIAHDPMLENPGFTIDLSNWWPSVGSWVPIDADGSETSGAIRVASTELTGLASETCIPMPVSSSGNGLTGSVRFRYRVLSGHLRFVILPRVGYAGDMGELGCIGPGWFPQLIHEAGGPTVDFQTFDSGAFPMPAAPRGGFGLLLATSSSFEVLIDDIGFNVIWSPDIFESDFEEAIR